ncbi:alpha/beta fold hydrolase [Sorangium sp. So ce1097]|uniref:alpha/beta fold hydrolase n=1 Tax=Sorangium sp. So ce1097 TaxID=3133330 RepID=UPI003F5F0F88
MIDQNAVHGAPSMERAQPPAASRRREGASLVRGHIATIAGFVASGLAPEPGAAAPWRFRVPGGPYGAATLSGLYFPAFPSPPAGSRDLVILVHGMGGDERSAYLRPATAALRAQGLSVLRLGQRGSSRDPEDLHHAGLWEDIAAVLSGDPIVARHDRAFVVGFSMGGHVGLHLAAAGHPRLAAVVSICSPLYLDRAVSHMDRRESLVYRRHVLSGLKRMYRQVARRRPMPVPTPVVDRAETLREWDRLTVVRRFGFRDPAAYYEAQGAGRILRSLVTPALLLYSSQDPMVPPATLAGLEAREGLSSPGRVVWMDGGGHIALPRRLDLGLGPAVPRAPYAQIAAWLRRHEAAGRAP